MGEIHARILSSIPGVRLTALAAGDRCAGAVFARRWNVPFWSQNYEECLARPDVDAVVIASPSALHAAHALIAIGAGKAVLIEIPIALSLADSLTVADAAAQAGVVAMVCHTRRFAPPHRALRERMGTGTFHLHHLIAETFFLRRTNLNMSGEPRTWTDNLLWHHACHSVDLVHWLLDAPDFQVVAQRGPDHRVLNIPMDMTIGLKDRNTGALGTLALSFNAAGPAGHFYRYIGEEDTYQVHRNEMLSMAGERVELTGDAFEIQDREFVAAVREGRTPEADIASVIPAMTLLDAITRSLDASR